MLEPPGATGRDVRAASIAANAWSQPGSRSKHAFPGVGLGGCPAILHTLTRAWTRTVALTGVGLAAALVLPYVVHLVPI